MIRAHSRSLPGRFIESLRKHITAEEVTALTACLDCRQCGGACAWHLATREPALHPKYKKDFIRDVYQRHIRWLGRVGGVLGWVRPLSEQTLRDYFPYFWKCTTCGRCTLACPLGLSTRSVVRLARAAFSESGMIRENPALREIQDGSEEHGHSFGLTPAQVHLRLGLFLTHEDTEIPFDVPGADYLYVCAAVGNTKFPDYGIQVPRLLNAAGVRYTFSSRLTDTGTDVEYVLNAPGLSREMLLAVESEALRLRAGTLLISECGCDVRTFYVDAGRILGRPLRVAVQSLDSLFLRAVDSGVLPVRKVPGKVTYHDSCKISRLSGLGELGRKLLSRVSESVVEMSPNRENNYCCNGGTGPLRLPENHELRRRVSRMKAEQIRATGAGKVITPCSVCMLTLEDIGKTYQLTGGSRLAFLLFEQVYSAVFLALRGRGESRFRLPAVFQGQAPEFIRRHGLSGRLEKIFSSPEISGLLEGLSQDAVVQRYFSGRPDAAAILETWRKHGWEPRAPISTPV